MTISAKAWKLIAEAKIEQAIRDGEFDDLPGFGKPLDIDIGSQDEYWWLKAKAKCENLDLLPPALILKRDVWRRTERIIKLESETEVRRAIQDLNHSILAANLTILWGPPSEVQTLDEDTIVAKWRDRRDGGCAD